MDYLFVSFWWNFFGNWTAVIISFCLPAQFLHCFNIKKNKYLRKEGNRNTNDRTWIDFSCATNGIERDQCWFTYVCYCKFLVEGMSSCWQLGRYRLIGGVYYVDALFERSSLLILWTTTRPTTKNEGTVCFFLFSFLFDSKKMTMGNFVVSVCVCAKIKMIEKFSMIGMSFHKCLQLVHMSRSVPHMQVRILLVNEF